MSINLLFGLNTRRVLVRIFPFLNKKLILSLCKNNQIFVNYKSIGYDLNCFRVGDFVRIAPNKKFIVSYITWTASHGKYLAVMSKNLHQYYKSQRQKFHNRRKNYLENSSLYTSFFKPVPRWVEVNFLSLSFFIIKTPDKLVFDSINYNPYLSKLIFF